MDSKKDFENEFWIMTLIWGTPAILGIIGLIISTILSLMEVFPTTPSIVFQIINGISIALIIIFGIIWSQKNKKLQEKYRESLNKKNDPT